MYWVDAPRVHAEMVDSRAVVDWPNVELVCHPMSKPCHPLAVDLDMEDAVSTLGDGSVPVPTPGNSFELRLESFLNILWMWAFGHASHYTTPYTQYIGAQFALTLEAAA